MCNCIETVNATLAQRNTKLSEAITFGAKPGTSLMIETELVEKKRGARATVVFPTHCPFCGEVLGDGK